MNDYHPSSGTGSPLHLLAEIGEMLCGPDLHGRIVPLLDIVARGLGLDLYLCYLSDAAGDIHLVAARGVPEDLAEGLAAVGDDPGALSFPGLGTVVARSLDVGGETIGRLILGARREKLAEEEILLAAIIARDLAAALGRELLAEKLKQTRSELRGVLESSEITLLQLDAVFRSINEGIIITSLDGDVLAMNPCALELLGFENIEECNRHFDNYLEVFQAHYLDSEMVPVDEWPVQRIVRGESFNNIEVQVRRLDTGHSWTGSFSGAPVRNRDGEIFLAAITMRDITEQKRGQRELKEAKRAAELANRLKDRFLGVMSHELRTPLMPVLTLAHLLETDPALPIHLRSHAGMIRRNVEVEVLLIDDLLDLTLIDKGKLHLERRSVGLDRLIGSVLDACGEDIARKDLQVTVAIGADHSVVDADPVRLKQGLRSLIKTVINLAGRGDRIALETEKGEFGVRLSIGGTGRGMIPRLLRHMFENVEGHDSLAITRFGGAGVSLAVGRALIELHGGHVTVAGDDDAGHAVLHVDLPASGGEESAETESGGVRGEDEALRVLIVEDHEDTGWVMQSLLNRDGYHVSVVTSVAGAIELAAADRFDLLICDIALPDGTGLDVMHALGRMPGLRALAISGYGSEADVQRSLDAGFDSHLTKPVTYQKLHDAIMRLKR